MVTIALAAVLAASPSLAAPAAPLSFETSVSQIQTAVRALRAAQLNEKSAQTAGQLENMAWDLQRFARETSRIKQELSWLRMRASRQRRENGRDSDPALRWDLRRFTDHLQDLNRQGQWSLDGLRQLASQAQKDDSLVFPAQRLLDASKQLHEETRWLAIDARFAQFEFLRAGYAFEGMEIDRGARDAESRTQETQSESERLLGKVRGA